MLWLISSAQTTELQEYLNNLDGVEFVKIDSGEKFNEFYELLITQPLDHNNPDKGNFKQRVFLSLKCKKRPVVLVTEGYNAHRAVRPDYTSELTRILDANQIFVEHRYFGKSLPENMDYQYLTIENAANDHHRVVELFKPFFKAKWVNTGISKGGQTAMYHRYFFPNDVDASVPYVGPLMFSKEDERFYDHMDNIGTKKCRKDIHNFQKLMLKNKEELLPKFIEGNKAKGYTYRKGYEHGFEYMVLEYSFAFWQWGSACASIPDKTVGMDSVYKHWEKVVGYGYLAEPKTKDGFSFMVQAMTDFGYYGYDVKEFKRLLDVVKEHDYDFVLPEGIELIYKPELMQKVKRFLQTEGDRILYIYGEVDPYTSQAVELTGECDAVKYVLEGGSHYTRIRHFPKEVQEEMFKKLEAWLDVDITFEFSK